MRKKMENAQLEYSSTRKENGTSKGKKILVDPRTSHLKVQKKLDNEITFYFCKKVGRMRKYCFKYAKRLI